MYMYHWHAHNLTFQHFIYLTQVERPVANNGRPKGKPLYHLPTFETTVDTKCFPLSYNLDDVEPGQQPHPDIYCDFPTCTRETDTIVRLACFHCFHQACLPSNHCCPICAEPLKKKVQKLANTFNNGLLLSKNANERENDDDDEVHKDESNNAPLTGLNISDAELFYTSPEWSQKVKSILDTYATIPLPSRANHSYRSQPSATNTSSPSNSSSWVLTLISITQLVD